MNYSEKGRKAARIRWANHDPRGGPCKTCGVPMLFEGSWRSIPAKLRPQGWNRHGGLGECNRCRKAAKRAEGSTYGSRAPQMRAEDMLEDWDMLRSDGVTDLNVAARRIGTTKAALQKCLERAAKRGDERAVRWHNDQLGGLQRQSVAGYSTRRAA